MLVDRDVGSADLLRDIAVDVFGGDDLDRVRLRGGNAQYQAASPRDDETPVVIAGESVGARHGARLDGRDQSGCFMPQYLP